MSFERKDGNVVVRSIKPTRREGTVQVTFEQERLRKLDNAAAMLSVMMKGDNSFGSPYQTIVAFQNMSEEAVKQFGLVVGGKFPESWDPKLIIHEFCEGDTIPESLRGHYNNATTFAPRVWDGGKQLPKMTPQIAGKEQQVLTRGGQPIYRNTFLVLDKMDHEDYLIKHDNEIAGTTRAVQSGAVEVVTNEPAVGAAGAP